MTWFLIVLGVILALLGTLCLLGTSRARYTGAEPSLSDWMAQLPDERLLRRIVIPGSHDAGTHGIIWAGETQALTIAEQLASGVRYFDLRVHKKNEDYVIFHSVMDGVAFEPILADMAAFLAAHPGEVLLLDFQHFKGGSQAHVKELLLAHFGADGLLRASGDKLAFARSLTLGEARGKALIFWGDRENASEDFLFPRNNNECTEPGMCLDSHYLGELHKLAPADFLAQAHPLYFSRRHDLEEAGEDAFFVLQCQLTDGLYLRGPWSRERIMDPVVGPYVRSLAESPERERLNIIMRDFVNAEKCRDILSLN